MSIFDLKSKKRPELPSQGVDDKKQSSQPQPAQELTPEEGEQTLMNVLTTLREIHEGSCIVTLLVTENEIQIHSTQKVVVPKDGDQK